MPILPGVLPSNSDVEILSFNASQTERSPLPYVDAYNPNSAPILLPIPSDEPTDTPDAPFVVDETAKARRAPLKRSKQKTAAFQRDAVPEALKSARGTIVPRFGSANSRAPLDLPEGSASTSLPDVIINVGGPISTLDWCPAAPMTNGEEAGRQYIVVGANPKGMEMNPIGKLTQGKAILQIWELQHAPVAPAKKAALPKLALGICHNRGVVWDAKWCPNASAASEVSRKRKERDPFEMLGYLAVVYGDGEVEILAVPKPDSLAAEGLTSPSKRQPPAGETAATASTKLVRLKPKAAASTWDHKCIGSCVDWLPTLPHDLLLVGTWEGAVIIYKVPSSCNGKVAKLERLSHILADMLPLRYVGWAPVETPTEDQGLLQGRVFCTAGHASCIKIWDYRDPLQPVMDILLYTAWILGAVWLRDPAGILITQDDGALRWVGLNPYVKPKHEQKCQATWWGGTTGSIWSTHASPLTGHCAYAGDGGEVVVAPPKFQNKSRGRPPHIVVSSTRIIDRVICMMGQEEPREAIGNKLPVIKGDITNPRAAVYKVRWGCAQAENPTATWLASGGATGFLRCQRISFYATF